MGRRANICVVGSANVDLTFRTARLPTKGETLASRTFGVGMGGKGANQAVAAARLGAAVSLVARVGNDAFGHAALRQYQAEGIDTTFVRIDAESATGTAAIVVDDHADNCIVVAAGANGRLSPADVRAAAEVLRKADVVLCQLETPMETAIEAFRIARAAGIGTMLTPAPARELPEELRHLCDWCVPNETELAILTGRTIADPRETTAAAEALNRAGMGAVVVTRGKRGALAVEAGVATPIPAVDVEAVDPTAAGDAFAAALAVALAEGESLCDAARQAGGVAALTVTRCGAQASLPTAAEVRAWAAARSAGSVEPNR